MRMRQYGTLACRKLHWIAVDAAVFCHDWHDSPALSCTGYLDDGVRVFHGLQGGGCGLAPYGHDASRRHDQIQAVDDKREHDEAARVCDACLHMAVSGVLASSGELLTERRVQPSSASWQCLYQSENREV